MPLKEWTLLVIPHDEIPVHKIKISGWLLAGILSFAFCTLIGIAYLTFSSYNKNCDYLELINLQRENRILVLKLGRVEHKLSMLNTKIASLMEENQVFRRIAGLEMLDEEITMR